VGWTRSRGNASARRSGFIGLLKLPYAPKHPCNYPGCIVLVDSSNGRCEKHSTQLQRDLHRDSAARRGYGSKWRIARKAFLIRNPLCAECLGRGILRAATVVDHVVPHRGELKLFWDESNWQSLCGPCHSRKTAKSDGRWG